VNDIAFFVSGLPKGQPRVKFASRGKFGKAYTPHNADDWKALVMFEAKRHCPATAIEGPVRVDIAFFFPRPKSHFTAKGLRPTAPKWHTAKPDRDNLDKLVLDGLTQLGFWRDDSQVCQGFISKAYAEKPGAAIEITLL